VWCGAFFFFFLLGPRTHTHTHYQIQTKSLTIYQDVPSLVPSIKWYKVLERESVCVCTCLEKSTKPKKSRHKERTMNRGPIKERLCVWRILLLLTHTLPDSDKAINHLSKKRPLPQNGLKRDKVVERLPNQRNSLHTRPITHHESRTH